jgi:hypothetical protein
MPLTKDAITSLRRQLITASSSIADAACRAGGDADLQKRLKDLWRGVRGELEYLDGVAPARIERPAAGPAPGRDQTKTR